MLAAHYACQRFAVGSMPGPPCSLNPQGPEAVGRGSDASGDDTACHSLYTDIVSLCVTV